MPYILQLLGNSSVVNEPRARCLAVALGATDPPSPKGRQVAGVAADRTQVARMVELTGFEPATSALQGRRSPELSYSPEVGRGVVGLSGFEPLTSRLSGVRSQPTEL